MTITPLGSAVEPEVYWRKASVSRPDPGVAPVVGTVVAERVGGQVVQAGELGDLLGPARDVGPLRRGGQDRPGPGLRHDRAEPGHRPVDPGQVRRHGDGPGVEAAEERGHEVQPRRVEQQGPLSGEPQLLKPRGQGARPAVQRGEAERGPLALVLTSRVEGQGALLRLVGRPPPEDLDETGRIADGIAGVWSHRMDDLHKRISIRRSRGGDDRRGRVMGPRPDPEGGARGGDPPRRSSARLIHRLPQAQRPHVGPDLFDEGQALVLGADLARTLPARGGSRSDGQSEYCPSWLTTT